MRANSVGLAAVLLLAVSPTLQAQRSAAPAARFELTVDSIMRGPDLVGYPPTGLRWSGDSQNLYFEWRKPGEDKASTYVVGRDGGAPRKLGDDEAKKFPPATGGRWDKARRRVLFVDGGDIVMVDAVAGTRRQITRTTGGESNPRWARNDTHVTWMREGNLFIAAGRRRRSRAADAAHGCSAAPPRAAADRQPALHSRRRGKADRLHREAKSGQEEGGRRPEEGRLPNFELQDRQTAADLMLSPDGTHVFIVVAERAVGMKTDDRSELRHRDGLHRGHSGPHERR